MLLAPPYAYTYICFDLYMLLFRLTGVGSYLLFEYHAQIKSSHLYSLYKIRLRPDGSNAITERHNSYHSLINVFPLRPESRK